MQTVVHLVHTIDKDGKTHLFQSSTANASEDYGVEDVIHHYTRSMGRKGAIEDNDRAKRVFGKNFDRIVAVQRGTSSTIPPDVKALYDAGKLPVPVMAVIKGMLTPSSSAASVTSPVVATPPPTVPVGAPSTSSVPVTGSPNTQVQPDTRPAMTTAPVVESPPEPDQQN